MTPELKVFLMDLRQHALFPELIKALETPIITGYRPSRSETLENLGANHCYQSGKVNQHKLWISFLTGQDISD